jgi:hypothetical protein
VVRGLRNFLADRIINANAKAVLQVQYKYSLQHVNTLPLAAAFAFAAVARLIGSEELQLGSISSLRQGLPE